MILIALYDTICSVNLPPVLCLLDSEGPGIDIVINNRRDLAPWLPFLRQVEAQHIGHSRAMVWWVLRETRLTTPQKRL